MAQTRCGPGRSEAWGYTEEGPLLFSKSNAKEAKQDRQCGARGSNLYRQEGVLHSAL